MLIFPQLTCLKHRGQRRRWEHCSSWVGFIQISCGILVQVRISSRAAGVWLLAETKTRLGYLHGKSSAVSHWQGQGQLWVCIMTSTEIFCPLLPSFAHPPPLFSAHLNVPGMKFCFWRFHISWSMVIKRTPIHITDWISASAGKKRRQKTENFSDVRAFPQCNNVKRSLLRTSSFLLSLETVARSNRAAASCSALKISSKSSSRQSEDFCFYSVPPLVLQGHHPPWFRQIRRGNFNVNVERMQLSAWQEDRQTTARVTAVWQFAHRCLQRASS